ncbi:MAG: BON domain-containing protein [Solirubrobacteraceae bacterium]
MSGEQTITQRIRARFERDEHVPHPSAIALGERAGTVTLRGTLTTPRQRGTAVHIAKSIPGVTFVSDELVLDPRDRTEDAEIRGTALQALISNAVLAEHVDVTVRDGWLTLKGEVRHQADSDAAFDSVCRLPGVGGITNKIKVVAAPLA